MKYKVTEKHPFLKEGKLNLLKCNKQISYSSNEISLSYLLDYDKEHIESWIDKNWIEEIEEPIYTKTDMKLFGTFINNRISSTKISNDCLERWIRKYKS